MFLRFSLIFNADGGAVRLVHLVRVVNLQHQVRGFSGVHLEGDPAGHFRRRGSLGPSEKDLFAVFASQMMSTVPRLLGGVVDADVATRLQDDVVGLVGVAVGLELGDVDGLAPGGDQVSDWVGDAKVVVVFLGNDVGHGHAEVLAVGQLEKAENDGGEDRTQHLHLDSRSVSIPVFGLDRHRFILGSGQNGHCCCSATRESKCQESILETGAGTDPMSVCTIGDEVFYHLLMQVEHRAAADSDPAWNGKSMQWQWLPHDGATRRGFRNRACANETMHLIRVMWGDFYRNLRAARKGESDRSHKHDRLRFQALARRAILKTKSRFNFFERHNFVAPSKSFLDDNFFPLILAINFFLF